MDLVGLTPRDFDRVILVGGSTRMPIVSRMVEQLFGQPPHLRVNPDEVVALGAAIQAHALNRSKSAHKRRSAHEQLAKAQPKATGEQIPIRPPEADPTVAPADVPQAPPLPSVDPPAPPPAPPAEPEFFTLNKAPAILSFDVPDLDVPPGPRTPPRPPPPPARPASQPRVPAASSASQPARSAALGPPAPPDAIGGDADIVPAPELELVPPTPTLSTGPVGQTSGSVSALPSYFESFELGAAVFDPTPERFQQGSAITTSAATPLLIDVTPLSLGVETAGGYSDVLIPASSPVPCEKTRTFLTARDNQTTVSIRVAQGESSRFSENTHLGDLELSGLRPARRGEVKIAVTFELDADGILNVRARDQDTGRETTATMRLLGANTDAEDVRAMAERQARHVVV
jgi:molecular chaperone DnaK